MITLSELCDGTLTPRYSNENMAHIAAAIKERLPEAHDHTYLSLGDIAMLPTRHWPTEHVWDIADSVLRSRGFDCQTRCKIAHILTTSLRKCLYWMEADEQTKYMARRVHANLRYAADGIACLLDDDPKNNRRFDLGAISYQIKGVICLHYEDAVKQAMKQSELERLHVIEVFPPIHLA